MKRPITRVAVLRRLMEFIAFIENCFSVPADIRAAVADVLRAIYDFCAQAFRAAMATQPLARAWVIITTTPASSSYAAIASLRAAAQAEREMLRAAVRDAGCGNELCRRQRNGGVLISYG